MWRFQVINAALALAAKPNSKVAQDNMDAFKDQWEKQVRVLTDAVDDITSIDDFLSVSGKKHWLLIIHFSFWDCVLSNISKHIKPKKCKIASQDLRYYFLVKPVFQRCLVTVENKLISTSETNILWCVDAQVLCQTRPVRILIKHYVETLLTSTQGHTVIYTEVISILQSSINKKSKNLSAALWSNPPCGLANSKPIKHRKYTISLYFLGSCVHLWLKFMWEVKKPSLWTF